MILAILLFCIIMQFMAVEKKCNWFAINCACSTKIGEKLPRLAYCHWCSAASLYRFATVGRCRWSSSHIYDFCVCVCCHVCGFFSVSSQHWEINIDKSPSPYISTISWWFTVNDEWFNQYRLLAIKHPISLSRLNPFEVDILIYTTILLLMTPGKWAMA